MNRRVSLLAVKGVHTIAFCVIATSGLVVFWDGVRGRPRARTGVAMSVALAECGLVAANDFVCPLTPMAERYGAKRGSVSDLFLPDRVSEHLAPIGGTILLAGIALNFRALRRRRRVAAG